MRDGEADALSGRHGEEFRPNEKTRGYAYVTLLQTQAHNRGRGFWLRKPPRFTGRGRGPLHPVGAEIEAEQT